jgi:hypothetical protein
MLKKEELLASEIHLISLNEIDYKFCSAYLLNQSLTILIVGTVPEYGISGRAVPCCICCFTDAQFLDLPVVQDF